MIFFNEIKLQEESSRLEKRGKYEKIAAREEGMGDEVYH